MPTGRPHGAKLFLEGKEVPFIGASITHTVNTASIAYIDLVPEKEINNIKPRTHVVLAVRDFMNPDKNFPYVQAWEGEVFGFSSSKTTTGRTFTIQCIDLSGYWDNVLTYFLNILHSLGRGAQNISEVGTEFQAASATGVKTVATTHSNKSFFRQIMEGELAKGGDLLDGFIAVYRNISKVNAFYNLAESRLRIQDRIVLQSSKKLQELIKGLEAMDWLEGIATRTTGYQTLRMVIQDLLSIIFHDYVTVPFPSRVDSDSLAGSPLKAVKNEKKTIGSFVFKPNLYMVPPPSCNIFFPDEYSSFSFGRNFFKEPTRMHYRPEMPSFLGGGSLTLPFVFQPDSFASFMVSKNGSSDSKGVDSTDSDGNQGKYNDPVSGDPNTNKKRDYQFLTNEEKIKGIMLYNEKMMPATTQFSAATKNLGKRDFSKKVAKYLFYKKRYESRQLQITSHLKLSVVPGFPVILLDDSDADQNIVAYCSSVTHRIYATEGGYTNVSLSYARNVAEQDASSNRAFEPPVPPWYDTAVFGEIKSGATSKAAKNEVRDRGAQHVTPDGLALFYKGLLGDKGSKAITNLKKDEKTLVGATRALLIDYAEAKSSGSDRVQDFIAKITSRDYVRLRDSFDFLGAKTETKDLRDDNFIEFTGSTYRGDGRDDSEQIKSKRVIIDRYRQRLKESRGFRG